MSDEPRALYQRYRPTWLSRLVGQPSVTKALTATLKTGDVKNTYLFSGPRGCGKTSTARIFAKALNCTDRQGPDGVEPCGKCTSCTEIEKGVSPDVIELDAATHNGVDDVREIVKKAGYAAVGQWRVYILDEAHMITTQGFNAMLKTLEDTPERVVFILATTDPRKLPQTVRSRSQHLHFRLVTPTLVKEHLQRVAQAAKLDVGEDVIEAAVRQGNGSLRDALSALDVLALTGVVGGEESSTEQVLSALEKADLAEVLKSVALTVQEGVEPRVLAEDLLKELREMFFVQMGAGEALTTLVGPERREMAARLGPRKVVQLITGLGEAIASMRSEYDHRVNLEIALSRWCVAQQ